MLDEHVGLFERTWIEQQFDPLARGELAAAVLRLDATLATACARRVTFDLEFVDDVLHRSAP
jgi:hypothetical protein